jgi:uncharacterized protein with von Willebrand factor type A (vWA) domain
MGGTNILEPLNSVFEYNPYKGRIFLLTDGEIEKPQEVFDLIE